MIHKLNIVAAWLLLCLLLYSSLLIGVVDISDNTILNKKETFQLLMVSRLPRTLAIVLVAISLSASGLVMQLVMRNQFVEPSTIGTPQGVAVGLLICTIFAPQWPMMAKMTVGSIFGFISLLLFLKLSYRLPVNNNLSLPIIGLVYGGIISAGVTFIAYEADLLQLLSVWLSGEFSAVLQGRYELLFIGALVALSMYIFANQLSIAGMGEDISKTLGLPYQAVVAMALVLVSIATSVVVSTVGMISFLGLISANIVRRFKGDNLKKNLPWTIWLGVVLLLLCDITARLARFPFELPVSLVFGILGAVVFLCLLWPHRLND